jgi:hypothetical protein
MGKEYTDEAAHEGQHTGLNVPETVPVTVPLVSLEELLADLDLIEPNDAVWKRQPEEPSGWYKRFTKFRLMEPDRKISKVFREEEQAAVKKGRTKPARSLPNGTWYAQAQKWEWQARAEAWDAWVAGVLEKHIAREKAQVLTSGLALMHKRIEVLNGLAQQLLAYTADKHLVWLPDVKSVGTGSTARQVDLIRFNAELFSELRAMLADIAAEKGERVKTTKSELSGPEGGPIETNQVIFYRPLVQPEPDEGEGSDGAGAALDEDAGEETGSEDDDEVG